MYRFYETNFPLSSAEEQRLQNVFSNIRNSGAVRQDALQVLEDVLLHLPYERDDAYCLRVAHFYQRCMQFTGPLMAKGVEDTVMYTYNRFIGHNEVGDAPGFDNGGDYDLYTTERASSTDPDAEGEDYPYTAEEDDISRRTTTGHGWQEPFMQVAPPQS